MGMTNEEMQKFLSEHPDIQLTNIGPAGPDILQAWEELYPRDASRALDSDIEIPAPCGLSYLPFQRAGIAYAAQRNLTLVADEMGLGKTIQAIGYSNLIPEIRRVLIVCPASLKLNWKKEWQKWDVKDLYVEVAEKSFDPASQVVIVNYDRLKKLRIAIRQTEWDLLIVDEAHFLKSSESSAYSGSPRRDQAECGQRDCGPVFSDSGRTSYFLNGHSNREQTEGTLADVTSLRSVRLGRFLVRLCEKVLRALGIERLLRKADRMEVGWRDEPVRAPRSASERIYGAATEMRRIDVFTSEGSTSSVDRVQRECEEAHRYRDLFLRRLRERTQELEREERDRRRISDGFDC